MNRKTVLVVDDEPMIRELCGELLVQNGYEVYLASNGQEAICLASECAPNLAIVDERMPGMSGTETVQHLRRQHPTVKVIRISGDATPEDHTLMRNAGFDAFLPKPFNLNDLLGLVREAVGGK